MSDPLDLAALARLCDEATPGPWTVELDDYRALSVENAAFIAAARTAVPALLAEVTALRGELARAHAGNDEKSAMYAAMTLTAATHRDKRLDALERAARAEVERDAARVEVERMRPLAVVARAAQAWRDASLDVEGQAWREQRALMDAIDALAKGKP